MNLKIKNFIKAFDFIVQLLNRNPSHWQFCLFLICFSISFLIFFFRNPDPFLNPIFYTEDGRHYVGLILSLDFGYALFHARPDYPVYGNVILAGVAVGINQIFYSGNILYLPQIIAVVSYLFFALVASLPVLLFGNRIKTTYLIVLALISSFFPLGHSDLEVIGRLSNVGYAFVYIAFLLTAYRLSHISNYSLIRIIIIDLAITIAACTNPVVYLIFPAIYLPYLKKYFINKIPFRNILTMASFWSAIFVGIVLLFQIINIITGPSVSYDESQNQLAWSFDFSKAIEMLVARSILYPIIYSIYGNMNNVIVMGISATIVAVFIKFSNRNNQDLYFLGTYSLIVFTIAAAVVRPGLSTFLDNYTSTFPDRYYYGQNLLAIFFFVLLVNDIACRLSQPAVRVGLLALMLTIFLAAVPKTSNFGRESLLWSNPNIGTLEQSLVTALAEKKFVNISAQPEAENRASPYLEKPDPNGSFLVLQIYPSTWTMVIPKELAETSVAQGSMERKLQKCQSQAMN
jgi:hypothetical protein